MELVHVTRRLATNAPIIIIMPDNRKPPPPGHPPPLPIPRPDMHRPTVQKQHDPHVPPPLYHGANSLQAKQSLKKAPPPLYHGVNSLQAKQARIHATQWADKGEKSLQLKGTSNLKDGTDEVEVQLCPEEEIEEDGSEHTGEEENQPEAMDEGVAQTAGWARVVQAAKHSPKKKAAKKEVKNIVGTSHLKKKGMSWKQFHKNKSKLVWNKCAAKGCGKKAEVGAHVYLKHAGASGPNRYIWLIPET